MKYVVAYLPELFFRSKVVETSKQLGIELRCTRELQNLVAQKEGEVAAFIVDGSGGEANGIAEILRHLPPSVPRVTFLSHVDEERAALLETTGATVMTKGQFTKLLPQLLTGWK